MKTISFSPACRTLLLVLLGAGLTAPLAAQDESPMPDANPEPAQEESPSADAFDQAPPASDEELPSSPLPAGEATNPSAEESVPTDIPQEIQDDVDVTGPRVDDSYNSLDQTGESIFSQIYVGPTIQIGFPQPLSYGLEALFARTVSVGFSTGQYTVDAIDKAELKMKGWDVHARWHPWLGSFFVGAAYGRMELDGTYEDSFTARVNGFERDVNAKIFAHIKTNYFSPRIGWFAVWESGLTVGFEIGAQIPMGPYTSVNATIPGATAAEEAQVKATSDYQDLEDQANDTVKFLGKRTVPMVTLLKVGWLF